MELKARLMEVFLGRYVSEADARDGYLDGVVESELRSKMVVDEQDVTKLRQKMELAFRMVEHKSEDEYRLLEELREFKEDFEASSRMSRPKVNRLIAKLEEGIPELSVYGTLEDLKYWVGAVTDPD